MTDRPILFSAPMVRALIAGTKTQTRRSIKFSGMENVLDFVPVATDPAGRRVYELRGEAGQSVARRSGKHFIDYHFSPPIAVGDRLWVREAWRVSSRWDDAPPRDLPERTMSVILEAGGSIANEGDPLRWVPSDWPLGARPEWVGKFRQAMHMPRWASRITLVVEGVKIERLQAISKPDALAEGIEQHGRFFGFPDAEWDEAELSAIMAYRRLWNRINGADAWVKNPWVVAYTFRRIMGNIDTIAEAA